jgi:hypothetical protein
MFSILNEIKDNSPKRYVLWLCVSDALLTLLPELPVSLEQVLAQLLAFTF